MCVYMRARVRGRRRAEGGEEGEGPDASARESVKTNEVCVCELRERSGTYSIHAYACSYTYYYVHAYMHAYKYTNINTSAV